jgi:hypothetical protein
MAKNPSVRTQVKNGFRAAGAALLGLGWLGLVIGGLIEAFAPPSQFTPPGTPHPIVGWVLLIAAATIFVTTVHHWVKALPGILGLAGLNALFSIFSGHAPGLPSVLIPLPDAIGAALLLYASAYLSISFTKRELRLVDRLAFLIYATSIFWGAAQHRHGSWMQMGIGTFCLFSAWAYDRIQRSKDHNHRPSVAARITD